MSKERSDTERLDWLLSVCIGEGTLVWEARDPFSPEPARRIALDCWESEGRREAIDASMDMIDQIRGNG